MAILQSTGVTGSLNISSSGLTTGSVLFAVDGYAGRLFSIDDNLSGSLFSVNTIAGLPIVEVFSDNSVNIGKYNAEAIKIPSGGSDVYLGSGSVMFVSSSGQVGIGTNVISGKLHIRDDTFNPTLVLEDRSSTNDPYIRFIPSSSAMSFALGIDDGDADKFKLSFSASNAAALGTNDYLVISSSGNVGIGTTSPNGRLTVLSDGSANTYSGVLRIADTGTTKWGGIGFPDTQSLTSTSNNYYLIGRGGAYADRVMSFHIPIASNYGSGAQPKFGFYSTGTDLLHSIEASTGTSYFKGNVGIGTTSPTNKLHVNGTLFSSVYPSNILSVDSTSTVATDIGGGISFGNLYNGVDLNTGAIIHGGKENSTSGNVSTYLRFFTREHPSNPAERMRINSSGNVGIGTTSPSAKLHSVSTTEQLRLGYDTNNYSSFTVASNGTLTISTTNGSSTADLNISPQRNLNLGTSNTDNIYIGRTDLVTGTYNRGIFSATTTASVQGLYQDNNGNVGIGTTSPAFTLDVSGSSRHGYQASDTHQFTGSVSLSDGLTATNATINGNLTVTGSIFASLFSASNIYITSSQLVVTDNIITLNALSPYQRYAGIQMYDSGSGTLSNFLWDGQGDYFFISGSGVNGKLITGPDNQADLTANYIPKATAGYKLDNSLIYDNGTNLGINTTGPTGSLHIENSTSTIPILSLGGGEASLDVADLYVLNSFNTGSGVGYAAKVIGINISGSLTAGNIPLQRTVWSGVNSATAIVLSADDPGSSTDDNAFQIWTSNQGTSGSALTQKFSLTSAGDVGIGTTSPAATLHVSGSSGATATFQGSAQSTMNLKVGSFDNYLVGTSTGDISIRPSGSTAVTILSGGNVGIGTTSPGAKLHTYFSGDNGLRIQSTDNHSSLYIKSSDSFSNYIRFEDSGTRYFITVDSGDNMYFRPQATTDTSKYIAFNSSGNVGIGTTSPVAKLQVGGNISGSSFTSSISNAVGFLGTSSWAQNVVSASYATTAQTANALNGSNTYTIAGLTSAYVDVTGAGTIPTTGIYRPSAKTLGLSADGTLIFKISNVSAPATSSIETGNFLVSSGNVGIGTNNAGYTLQIGQNTVSDSTNYRLAILRNGTSGSPGSYQSLAFQIADYAADGPASVDTTGVAWIATPRIATSDTNADNASLLTIANDTGHVLRASGKQNVYIGYTTATTSTQTNSLLVSGNVGIGTTSPVAKLQVNGNISGSSFTSSISNAVGFLGTSSWALNALTASSVLTASSLVTTNNYTINNLTASGAIRAAQIAEKIVTFTPLTGSITGAPAWYRIISGSGVADYGRVRMSTTFDNSRSDIEFMYGVRNYDTDGAGAFINITRASTYNSVFNAVRVIETGNVAEPYAIDVLIGNYVGLGSPSAITCLYESQFISAVLDTPTFVSASATGSNIVKTVYTTYTSGYPRIGPTYSDGLAVATTQGQLSVGYRGNYAYNTPSTLNYALLVSGSVGIGTSSPSTILYVNKASGDSILTLDNTGNGNTSGINFNRERLSGTGVNAASIFVDSDTSSNNAFLYIQAQSAGANAGVTSALTANNGVRLILRGTTGIFSIENGASETFRIDNNGNVGIGTTSPSNILHIEKTQNAGLITLLKNPDTGTSQYVEFRLVNQTNSSELRLGSSYNYSSVEWNQSWIYSVGRNLALKTDGSNAIRFYTGGTSDAFERMRINSSGNVGIGVTNPLGRLHITGSATNGETLTLLSKGSGSITQYYINALNQVGQINYRVTSDQNGHLGHDLSYNGTVKVSHNTFWSSWINNDNFSQGSLGIGTNSQTHGYGLFINNLAYSSGSLKVETSTATANRYVVMGDGTASTNVFTARLDDNGLPYIKLQNLDSAATTNHGVGIRAEFSDNTGSVIVNAGGLYFLKEQQWTNDTTSRDSALTFHTSLNNSASEKVRITSDGNVGIGTTSPSYNLEVVGNMRVSNGIVDAGSSAQWTLSGGGTVTWNGSSILWGTRVIAIPVERTEFGNSGYIDINCPTSGTVTYYNSSNVTTTVTCTANGIPLSTWEALYYEVTPGQANTSDPTKFRVVAYQNSTWRPSSNWLLIATRNGDSTNGHVKWIPGQINIPYTGGIYYSGTGLNNWETSGTTNYVSKFTGANSLGNSQIFDNGTSVGIGISTPVSLLHIYQNDSSTSTSAGLTVENDGTGDAIVQFLLTNTKRWVIGIDNSDSTKFKIADSADLNTDARFVIDNNGNVGIGTTSPGARVEISGSSNSALLNIKSPISGAILYVSGSGAIGVGTQAVGTYRLQVSGSFAATTKSFVIDHPTKQGKKLIYGSLESPYHGIRLTGRDTLKDGKCKVELPEYMYKLILHDSINIQLTGIKCNKTLYVDDINIPENYFTIAYDKAIFESYKDYDFFWDFTAIRSDVPELETEL